MKRLSILCAGLLLIALPNGVVAQQNRSRTRSAAVTVPPDIVLRLIRAEDERRWDEGLPGLLTDKSAKVRQRAALAAGRIGDERAVPALAELLLTDREADVRQVAAFALGEIESPGSAIALISVLKDTGAPGRARAVEALGKIAAVLASTAPAPNAQTGAPKTEDERPGIFRTAILDALKFEAGRRSASDRLTILLGLTATLRARPEGAGPVIAQFLSYSDPRIVADALNTMARLRLKANNDEVRELLLKNGDPIVRANAARVAGAAEDKGAFDALLDRAIKDSDSRVRAGAIRSLGVLKDERAVMPLSRRGIELFRTAHPVYAKGASRNEGLEILNALGLILAGKPQSFTGPETAARMELSLAVRAMTHENILEDEIARARQTPEEYLEYLKGFESAADVSPDGGLRATFYGARSVSARAAGLGELGRIKPLPESVPERAQSLLRRMLDDRRTPLLAVPNILNSYAVFKPKDIAALLPGYLRHSDVIVRATAAELLGELGPDNANREALIAALTSELTRTGKGDENDAALAILDALGKQKSAVANDAIKTALDSSDHLLRRKAVALLKANGVGDFSSRIGTVKTRNTEADYLRAIARIGKQVRATVETSRGAFTIEFLPADAPLTVDNFVQLARRGYFNGQTIPRVVPNFVVQAGDPRGDQNGGPGYQIRCELNQVPFERGAVGMALSGKDTGGSQWFVTHSPQPHLDGGYTVFGRVISGMAVVDSIARGDIIRRVKVFEQR